RDSDQLATNSADSPQSSQGAVTQPSDPFFSHEPIQLCHTSRRRDQSLEQPPNHSAPHSPPIVRRLAYVGARRCVDQMRCQAIVACSPSTSACLPQKDAAIRFSE